LQEHFSVFWANSVGFIYPEDYSARSDGINMTSMIGVAGQITPAISGTVGIGYVHSQFEPVHSSTSTNSVGSGMDGVSASIGLSYTHPLRPSTTHSIGGYYSPGVTATMNQSNYQTSYGVTYSITHRLSRAMTVSPKIVWSHTQSEGGLTLMQYDVINIGMVFTRSFTRSLYGTLEFTHTLHTSPEPIQNYEVNRVRLNFNYMF
jgi:hypothetical protein